MCMRLRKIPYMIIVLVILIKGDKMPRYAVKNNKAYFGWETGGFKKIGSTIAAPTSESDFDWVLNMESIPLDELKPKKERIQKWFVNNATRKMSYTYDTEYKAAEGSLSGDFKHSRVIDAVLGVDTRTPQSGYDEVIFDGEGNSRKTFFGYFEHGSSRAKSLHGMLGTELAIEMAEGDMVTFSLSTMVAQMIDIASAISITDNKKDGLRNLTREPFHWKHVAIKLTDGDPAGTHESLVLETGNSYQMVTQSGLATMGTATGLAGSTYKFKVNTIEYDVTTLADNTYQLLLTELNTNTSPSLPSNFYFRMTQGVLTCVSKDGTSVVLAIGDTADMFATMTLHTGFATAVDNIDGTEYESCTFTIANNSDMKFGAPSTGGQQWASWYREMAFEVTVEISMFPDVLDTILMELGPAENQYTDYADLLANGELGMEVLLQRDTNDFIRLRLKQAEMESNVESFSEIESGVDPISITLKFGEEASALSAYCEDTLLHSVSPFSA